MTLEECAARLTAFLTKKPRSGKTRAYLATLPPVRKKRIVQPSDFLGRAEAKATGRMAERDAQRLAAWEARGKPPSPNAPPAKRRLRPGAQPEMRSLMERMIDAQQGRCILCWTMIDMEADFDPSAPAKPSFDHVLPRSLGGANEGNRLIAHRHCNTDKGNRRPTGCELVWLAAVNARLAPAAEIPATKGASHEGCL